MTTDTATPTNLSPQQRRVRVVLPQEQWDRLTQFTSAGAFANANQAAAELIRRALVAEERAA